MQGRSAENRPGRPGQRVHARRLTPGRPAAHLPNPTFERDKTATARTAGERKHGRSPSAAEEKAMTETAITITGNLVADPEVRFTRFLVGSGLLRSRLPRTRG